MNRSGFAFCLETTNNQSEHNTYTEAERGIAGCHAQPHAECNTYTQNRLSIFPISCSFAISPE